MPLKGDGLDNETAAAGSDDDDDDDELRVHILAASELIRSLSATSDQLAGSMREREYA